ncbi:MAG: glycosyltransferase [Bacteroidales bacterium]|nr:glycosyltransferase [Bacteroidales bacterium]MCF8344450.1 glycosyltransferase [Bacteroidales bacterium]MCF8351596.1 glycosyltransferase [Bacteroidales bacterium]MCF8375278.1 glycosyltransferase [Bacteroidales bacterium]MCF8401248.1 glycosyltransferase [Bacteroidales bacterium]
MPADKNIHVLFLSRWYPHRYDPMPGLFVQRHAEAVALYTKVSLLYVHPDKQLKYKKHEIFETEENGVYTIKIYYRNHDYKIPFLNEIIKGWKYFRYNRKGIRLIERKKGKANLLHVNILTRLGVIAYFQKLLSGTPYIITEHWSRYLPITNTYHGKFRKRITKLLAKKAGAITAVTGNLKKAMQNHGIHNRNFEVVPNVVDTNKFIPAEKQHTGKKCIVHISCFEDRSKNISGIINVIERLSKKRDDFELILVGEGINLDQMKSLAAEKGLTDKTIRFTGLLENKTLIEALQQADFMLMFSNYENMPVVINESLSCGVPVISSDVGGISEVINPQTGLLVEKGNEQHLEEKINSMLDHFREFNSQKLREYAIKNFSYEAVGRRFVEIYEITINNIK